MRSASFSSAFLRSAAVAVRTAPFAVARLATALVATEPELAAAVAPAFTTVFLTAVLRAGLAAARISSAAFNREAAEGFSVVLAMATQPVCPARRGRWENGARQKCQYTNAQQGANELKANDTRDVFWALATEWRAPIFIWGRNE